MRGLRITEGQKGEGRGQRVGSNKVNIKSKKRQNNNKI
jgi:hypothetical protein